MLYLRHFADEEQLSRSSTLASAAGDTISQHASAAKGMQEGSFLRPEDGTKLGLHGPVSQQMQVQRLTDRLCSSACLCRLELS